MTLSGTGNAGKWEVDIDELDSKDSYGLMIRTTSFYLQLRPLNVSNIENLLSFLRAAGKGGTFRMDGPFGGRVDMIDREGSLFIRLVDIRLENCTNLFERSFEEDEREEFAKALSEAFDEARLV